MIVIGMEEMAGCRVDLANRNILLLLSHWWECRLQDQHQLGERLPSVLLVCSNIFQPNKGDRSWTQLGNRSPRRNGSWCDIPWFLCRDYNPTWRSWGIALGRFALLWLGVCRVQNWTTGTWWCEWSRMMRTPQLDLGLNVTSTTDVAWLRRWKGSWDPRRVWVIDVLEG